MLTIYDEQGDCIMSENEKMLINLIRNHNNTEEALAVALGVILDFLNHPESSASKSVVDSLELIETNQSFLSRYL